MPGARLRARAPDQIMLRVLLSQVGRCGLQEIPDRGDPESRACGQFQPRLKKGGKPPCAFR